MHNISTRVVCVNGKHQEPMGSCKHPLWYSYIQSYIQIGPFVLEKKHIMLLAAVDFFFKIMLKILPLFDNHLTGL